MKKQSDAVVTCIRPGPLSGATGCRVALLDSKKCNLPAEAVWWHNLQCVQVWRQAVSIYQNKGNIWETLVD